MRDDALNVMPRPVMYVPQAQITDAANKMFFQLGPVAWIVRTQGKPIPLVQAVRAQLIETTGVPVADILSMEQVVSRSTKRQQFNVLVMTVFGSIALLLAATGIYGLIAYMVAHRTKEIGIRLALGAEATTIQRMIVWQGMRLASAGVVVGFSVACSLSRVIGSLLFGIDAHDPLVFIAVPVVLGAVTLTAVWVPANRATRVNPMDSLRYE